MFDCEFTLKQHNQTKVFRELFENSLISKFLYQKGASSPDCCKKSALPPVSGLEVVMPELPPDISWLSDDSTVVL